MRLIEKMIAAIICSIFFAVIMTFILYVPEERREGGFYFELLPLFTLYIFLFTPIIIVFSMTIAVIIDKVVPKLRLHRYKGRFVLYFTAGVLFNYFFYVSVVEAGLSLITLVFFIYGIAASLTYLHTLVLIEHFSSEDKK